MGAEIRSHSARSEDRVEGRSQTPSTRRLTGINQRRPLIEGKEHLRDIARVADEYALCMDSTRACLHYLKARQLPVDRLFDQLGKALADWTEVLESVEPKVKAITPTTIHFAEKTMEAMCAYEEQIQKMVLTQRPMLFNFSS